MEGQFRDFFYQIFASDVVRRRAILKQWHNPYPTCKKKHARLADVYEEFICHLMYEPVRFKLRLDHFCLYGNGCDALSVRTQWLQPKERSFVVYSVFAERERLFKTRKEFENNQFHFEDFAHDPPGMVTGAAGFTAICDPMWQRQLMRDFVWLVLAKDSSGFMVLELIMAMQNLMYTHRMARGDVFLASLHNGLQGMSNVKEVLCWGNDENDLHSEEWYSKSKERDKQKTPLTK